MGEFRSKIDVQCWLDKDNAHPIPQPPSSGRNKTAYRREKVEQS
jgi:hypothetical protein